MEKLIIVSVSLGLGWVCLGASFFDGVGISLITFALGIVCDHMINQ